MHSTVPSGVAVATGGQAVADRTVGGTVDHMTLRAGQKAFNDLYEVDPVTADLIRGTDADPFYDDTRLPLFTQRVAELTAEPQP